MLVTISCASFDAHLCCFEEDWDSPLDARLWSPLVVSSFVQPGCQTNIAIHIEMLSDPGTTWLVAVHARHNVSDYNFLLRDRLSTQIVCETHCAWVTPALAVLDAQDRSGAYPET